MCLCRLFWVQRVVCTRRNTRPRTWSIPCSFTHVYSCTHRLTHSIVQEGTHSHSQQHAGRHSQPHVHLGIHRHTHGLTQTLEPRATSMSRSMLLHTLSPHDIINTYAHAFQCQPGTHPQTCTLFWSRRWAPPDIGCVRRPSSVRLCLRPPAVGLCLAVCVWPAGGGCGPPVNFQKKYMNAPLK